MGEVTAHAARSLYASHAVRVGRGPGIVEPQVVVHKVDDCLDPPGPVAPRRRFSRRHR